MPSQVTDRFTMEDEASTGAGSESWADVIPLYPEAATPPNMTPAQPLTYQAAPPPVEVPYGWRMVESPAGWLLVHEPAEWSVIARCVEGRRIGRPLDAIAEELHAEGAPIWNAGTRDYGAPSWHRERVRRLVARYAPELSGPSRKPYRKRTKRAASTAPPPRDLGYKDAFEELLAAAEDEEI